MSTAADATTPDPLTVWHGGDHCGEVLGGDGAVRLYRPAPDARRVWCAAAWADHAGAPALVAWSTPRGKRARYSCTACGITYGHPRCPHAVAAVRARDLLERNPQ